jgi:hypothetical protein
VEIKLPTGGSTYVILHTKAIATMIGIVATVVSSLTWFATSVVWAADFYEYKVGSEASMNAIQIDMVEERLYRAHKNALPAEEINRYAHKLERLERRQDYLESLKLELQAPLTEK